MTELIRLAVSPERIEIAPGQEPTPLSVSVFNASTIVDEFVVTVVGAGEWLSFKEERIRLFPDTGDTRNLMITIPDEAAIPAGERVVGVQVESSSDPSMREMQRITVMVSVTTGGEWLTLDPQIVHGGSSGVMRATVGNPGSAPMQVVLSGEDPEGAVRFSFSPASLNVPPFGQAAASVKVSAPPPKRGPERSRQLVVRAQGSAVAVAASSTFIQEPRLTGSRLLIARILLTLLGGGLLMISAFFPWANECELCGIEMDDPGTSWDYQAYGTALGLGPPDGKDVNKKADWPEVSGGILLLTSAGFVAIVMGGIGILGALRSRGGLTLGVGVLSILLLIGWALAPAFAPDGRDLKLESGFFMAVAGSVLFVIAGVVGSRSG